MTHERTCTQPSPRSPAYALLPTPAPLACRAPAPPLTSPCHCTSAELTYAARCSAGVALLKLVMRRTKRRKPVGSAAAWSQRK